MPLPSTKIVYITFMLQGKYFFCCLKWLRIYFELPELDYNFPNQAY